jgi:hypothetical protein
MTNPQKIGLAAMIAIMTSPITISLGYYVYLQVWAANQSREAHRIDYQDCINNRPHLWPCKGPTQ